MATQEPSGERCGKPLFLATRPLAQESLTKSWWYTVSTFVILGLLLAGAALAPWWPLQLVLSVIGGLVLVRAFVLYHDFMHGAILRKSPLGKLVYYTFGLIALTPPRYWRYSHNYHHAHVSKPLPVEEGRFSLLLSSIGTMPLMTAQMWQQASFSQKLMYRISRHPLTMLGAYIPVFFFSISLLPALQNPRRYWDGGLAILLHICLIGSVGYFLGLPAVLFACLIPSVIASALGAYLFFAQHNFEGMHILPQEEWSHFNASLESSSFMKLGPVGNWLTGNIGYHHVHHLNAMIPFYRLPETMESIHELQHPLTTTLHPRDVLKCLNLSLWDTQGQRLITFSQAAKLST